MGERKAWQEVFRVAASSCLTRDELLFIRDAIGRDDKRLIQGSTAKPPAIPCVYDWPAECGCLFGLLAFRDGKQPTVAQVENEFARIVNAIDARFPMRAAYYFLNWFDETPRDTMRAELLAEIDAGLAAHSVAA